MRRREEWSRRGLGANLTVSWIDAGFAAAPSEPLVEKARSVAALLPDIAHVIHCGQ